MRVKAAVSFLVLFAVAGYAAADKKEPQSAKNPAFEQFKRLAGEWVGKQVEGDNQGTEVTVKYKVTSAGSVVVETLFPDTPHEMVTVIHPDGDELALTHYCALGNQPHMKADAKGDSKEVAFKFNGASNLKSEKDMHMHDVTFTFVDKDTFKTEWTHYNDGKATGKHVFEFKRKK